MMNDPPSDSVPLLERIKAQLVKLRYFAGSTEEDVARVLCVSRATVQRHWRYAKACWKTDRPVKHAAQVFRIAL
jgi:ECF sigma factor